MSDPRIQGQRRFPPDNKLDQSTRDLIAHPPTCDNAENRKAFLLAAMDLCYSLYQAIHNEDPAYFVLNLLGWDNMDFASEDESEPGDSVFWKIWKAVRDEREPRKGTIGPAFMTDWWVDRKQVPPEMMELVTGIHVPAPLEQAFAKANEVIRAKPSPFAKEPYVALEAMLDEQWGEDE